MNRRRAPDPGLSLLEGGTTGGGGGAERAKRRLAVGAARRKGHYGRCAPIAGIMHNCTSEVGTDHHISCTHVCTVECGLRLQLLSFHIKMVVLLIHVLAHVYLVKLWTERLELTA